MNIKSESNQFRREVIIMAIIKKISTRGRLGIPIEVRRKYGLMGRMKAIFTEVGGSLVIKPACPKAAGSDKQPFPQLTRRAAAPRDSQ
jgi:bifunctional DNA-binding transcriptional regulator/antitoxin component of YhaV-PrlF toxin-antitoxin module